MDRGTQTVQWIDSLQRRSLYSTRALENEIVGARNNCQVADESLLKVASDLTLQRQWIRRRYNGWGYDGVSVGGGRYEAIVPDS